MSENRTDATDGARVIRAFECLAVDATRPEASFERVLEAAAMGIALAVLGLLERAVNRDRVAARARVVLLSAGAARASVEDEDARDALELALEQARRGASLLKGGPLSALDGPRALPPTPVELARLVSGGLDGHASADVALRLHRSGARDLFAALLPRGSAPAPRMRLAADSAPLVRDPSEGQSLGAAKLGSTSLEAYRFEGALVAIYAEPPVAISLEAADATLSARTVERSGYLEVRFEGDPSELTLTLTDGKASVRWSLPLR